MTREKCPAAVEVALGSYCEEGDLITCDLDKGHDDPNNAIGSRPVLPHHRAEWDEPTFAGVQAPDSGVATVHIVITWLTP